MLEQLITFPNQIEIQEHFLMKEMPIILLHGNKWKKINRYIKTVPPTLSLGSWPGFLLS